MKRVSLIVALLFTIFTTEAPPLTFMATASIRAVDVPPIGRKVAPPATFKCTTAEGHPAADLVVDIENRNLMWGGQKYAIRATDDRYVSAYLESQGEVGGEVWVFNRVTGEYLRASVYIGYDGPEPIRKNDPGKLTAATFRGKCSRPLL